MAFFNVCYVSQLKKVKQHNALWLKMKDLLE